MEKHRHLEALLHSTQLRHRAQVGEKFLALVQIPERQNGLIEHVAVLPLFVFCHLHVCLPIVSQEKRVVQQLLFYQSEVWK